MLVAEPPSGMIDRAQPTGGRVGWLVAGPPRGMIDSAQPTWARVGRALRCQAARATAVIAAHQRLSDAYALVAWIGSARAQRAGAAPSSHHARPGRNAVAVKPTSTTMSSSRSQTSSASE